MSDTAVAEPTTITTATVAVTDLTTVLAAALQCTDDGDGDWGPNPILSAVKLEARDSTICAVATNRYMLGSARKPATGALPPVLIDRGDVEVLLAVLHRADTKTSALAEVVTSAGEVTVTVGASTVTVPTVSGEYPTLAKVLASLPDRGSRNTAEPFALDGRYLERIIAVARVDPEVHKRRDAQPIRIYYAAVDAPVRFEIGDWFAGAVMPTKVGDRWERKAAAEMPNVPFGFADPA